MKSLRNAICGLFVIPFAICVGEGSDREPNLRYAVMDLAVGKGLDQDDGKTLADFITAELVRSEKLDVMDRRRVVEILKEQKFSEAICDDKNSIVKAGKILDANRIVGGRVSKFGASWAVSLFLVDVNTSSFVNSSTLNYEGPMENLLNLTGAAALKLLNLTPTPSEVVRSPKVTGVEMPSQPTTTLGISVPQFTGVMVSIDKECVKIKGVRGEGMFAINEKTKFGTSKEPKTATDFRCGDKVVVRFKQEGDKKVAVNIATAPPPKKKEAK